jgi:hypothetical protein
MALLTVSITDPLLNKKSAEVQFIQGALDTIAKEIGRGNGTVLSGTILGQANSNTSNVSLGTWTYTPSATIP